MRLITVGLVAVAIGQLCVSHVYAYPVCSRVGAITECGVGTLDNLHVAGKASLQGTKILGGTHVAGMLNAVNVDMTDLNVAGKVKLDSSHVNGIARISGLLTACQSQFNDSLFISSDMTHFENSTMKNIEVNPGGNSQVVYLSDNTVVKGDVNFTSGHGLVVMDATSVVKGRVKGGYINQADIQPNCKGETNA